MINITRISFNFRGPKLPDGFWEKNGSCIDEIYDKLDIPEEETLWDQTSTYISFSLEDL